MREQAPMRPGGMLTYIASWCTRYRDMQLGNIASLTSRPVTNEADARQALASFEGSLQVLLGGYAFARAGGEQAGYPALAARSLSTVLENAPCTRGAPDEFARRVWDAFQNACRAQGKGANERLNRGVIEGLAAWAVTDASVGLFPQLAKAIVTGDVESAFIRLCSLKGIGSKIAAFVLRDVVWLYENEPRICQTELLYLQPVDVWVRRVARILWPDLQSTADKEIPDFVFARRIAAACVQAGVSGVAWNQGAWWLGAQVAKSQDRLGSLLKEIREGPQQ